MSKIKDTRERLLLLEKEVAYLRNAVRESRKGWGEVEQDFKEIALEFCRKYDLKIPERLLK